MKQGKIFLIACLVVFLAPNLMRAAIPDLVIGKDSAPIKIVEYSSMTCHFCADFHKEILPQLKTKYIDTGKVQLIFRHFSSDEQGLAAAALVVGANPMRQLSILETLFTRQGEWMTPQYEKELAHLLNMDLASAQKIMHDKKIKEDLAAAYLKAENAFKIDATPFFIVNGHVINYKPTFEKLEEYLTPKKAAAETPATKVPDSLKSKAVDAKQPAASGTAPSGGLQNKATKSAKAA